MKRRSRNEGSIFYRKSKGLWVAKLTLPQGGTKTKYSKKQSVVREWLVTQQNQLRQGILPSNDTITVSDFMANYMETVGKHTLRPRTQEIQEVFVRVHINPALGRIKLKDLRPDHLQSFYSQKINQGLSKRTVQMMHTLIRTALKQAVKWGLVARNVTDLVQAPRPDKKVAPFYTKEQLSTFLKAAKGSKWYLIFLLLVYGGFREGEVLGIHYEDCDLVNKAINVRHTVITLKDGLHIGEPKTETSKRSVTLPKVAYDELKKYLDQLNSNQGIIFTTRTGTPISPRNLIREFKRIISEASLPDLNLHGLRHSHASLLFASGMNPGWVQHRLGHASITLTLDTYSHVIPSMGQQVADRLDEIMG